MNEELEKRFNEEIDKVHFNVFEFKGFQVQPKLALVAGCAIGYKMALQDTLKKLNETKAKHGITESNT